MLSEIISVIFFASLVTGFDEPPANYAGFEVIRVNVRNAEQVRIIRRLSDDMQVNLWNEPFQNVDIVLMSVSPTLVKRVKTQLSVAGMNPVTVIKDLQKVIDKERLDNMPSEQEKRQQGFVFNRYHNLDEINTFLRNVNANYKQLTTLVTIGNSYQNRPIQGLRITSGATGVKPAIFLECGIHAREWVTTASALYFINVLTSQYSNSTEIKYLVDTYEWYIMPTVNPDGYVYTFTNNRNWRKTRSPNSVCVGTDANRNFDVNFCGQGSSSNPCLDTYCGRSAFSESETKALRNITMQLGARLKMYFAIHSFSQLWMYPYGYTTRKAPNELELARIAKIGVQALSKPYKTAYVQGPINTAIYVASGSSIDWVYDNIGTRLTYALELRDQGQYGFMLPSNQIIPTAIETFEGIKAAVKAM